MAKATRRGEKGKKGVVKFRFVGGAVPIQILDPQVNYYVSLTQDIVPIKEFQANARRNALIYPKQIIEVDMSNFSKKEWKKVERFFKSNFKKVKAS